MKNSQKLQFSSFSKILLKLMKRSFLKDAISETHSQPSRQFAILCEKMIYEFPLIDSLKNVSNCSQKYVKLFT